MAAPDTYFASPGRRALFAALLSWTMVAATAAVVTLPVVATFIIEDFGISRAQFGILITSVTVGGAATSPFAGRLADRVGGRNAMLAVFVSAAAASLLFSVAPVFGAMFAGSTVALAGSAANPGTNKLIAAHVLPGRRGLITGIKQTGPQVGSFLAGVLAPLGAATFGWRPTVALISVFVLLPIPLVLKVIPADERVSRRAEGARPPLPGTVTWLAFLALLLGLGSSSSFLIPLFVEEGLGESNRIAGAAAALQGGVAIFGRIAWARLAERLGSLWVPTAAIALISILSAAAMLMAVETGPAWMWLGTILSALSSSSWTAVAALTVIALVGARAAGRATGIVWFGFLSGLGIGPPVYGWTVDRSGDYTAMWVLALIVFAGLVLAAYQWGHRLRRSS